MGFGYDVLDTYINKGKGPGSIIEKISRMNKLSSHKREYPTIYKHIKK